MLSNVIKTKRFLIFNYKYYLKDIWYSNLNYLLLPYKDIWYHLNKQILALQKPTNFKKLFNLYYTYLYNVIEQIFGIVKRQFLILNKALGYLQIPKFDIVYVIIRLYNFIKIYLGYEEDIYNVLVDIPDNTKIENEGEP